MAKEALHVVPLGEGWALKRAGVERPVSTHETQKAGIDAARSLATVGDDIVIHRPDGTIRNRVTYAGTSTNTDEPAAPQAHDLRSVGTRVSWSAVAAGVIVAVSVSALLTSMAAAIGLSTVDSFRPKAVAIAAGVVWMFIVIVAMLCGGYVATRTTTRETTLEAVILGVVVWGTTLALAMTGFGAGTGLALDATRAAKVVTADQPFWRDLGWTGEQSKLYEGLTSSERVRAELKLDEDAGKRYDDARRAAAAAPSDFDVRLAAWWVFAGLSMSLAAAIGGALIGCGPDVSRPTPARDAGGNGQARESQAAREPVAV